jgi:hypothetical protein
MRCLRTKKRRNRGRKIGEHMSYAELLKDPRWQRRRLEVMQLADFSCQSCGSKEKTLHVHHKRYIKGRKPWEYENSELACLCEICHESHHKRETTLTQVMAELCDIDASRVIGYALGLFSLREFQAIEIACESREQLVAAADGVASAYEIRTPYAQLAVLLLAEDGTIEPWDLQAIKDAEDEAIEKRALQADN